MQSFDLKEASVFLHMNAEVLRRKAKDGTVPARRAGRKWVFIREHLADWVSGGYTMSEKIPPLRLVSTNGVKQCQSTKGGISGGSNSQLPTGREYKELLGLK